MTSQKKVSVSTKWALRNMGYVSQYINAIKAMMFTKYIYEFWSKGWSGPFCFLMPHYV